MWSVCSKADPARPFLRLQVTLRRHGQAAEPFGRGLPGKARPGLEGAGPDQTRPPVALLMDGAFAIMPVHRAPAYVEAAGRAAAALATGAASRQPV